MKCIKKNCSEEYANFDTYNQKFAQQISQVNFDFLDKKISFSESKKRIERLTLEMLSHQSRIKLGECQLKHCYNNTHKMIKKDLQTYKKQLEGKLALVKKLTKMLDKKLTTKKILKYEVEKYKKL
jgi:hypothetical protein